MNTPNGTRSTRLPGLNNPTEADASNTGQRQTYRRILVATDFSCRAACAFRQGVLLARQNGAELLVAHVTPSPATISFMPAESFCAWQEFCKGEAEQNIRALVQMAREQGVKTHKVMLAGRAEHALLAAAERLGVDLIVIGAHGHRGVSGFLAGNVAAQLISHAPCSVLTAREGPG